MVQTPKPPEPMLSVRMIWPLTDLVGADPRGLMLLNEIGLTPEELADRDARMPCRRALHGLERLIEEFGDPLIGLKMGTQLSLDVLDVVEYAACSTENLGTAIAVMSRYVHLLVEACSLSVATSGELAKIWQTWTIPAPAAANDLVVMAALRFSQRVCQHYEAPIEVRLMHERPSYADAYASFFEAPVQFGAPANMIVIDRARLAAPLKRRNPRMAVAFERQVQALEQRTTEDRSTLSGRVRHALTGQLSAGSVSMKQLARQLDVSVATLRRKLEEESTSFTVLLDAARREAAERYLAKPEPTVTEIAFLLGFSNLRAFSRAFRRWTGSAPTQFRERALHAVEAAY
ncbi:MAG: hypothetical protein RL701_6492 [Pseudomonadota bacterium]